MRESDLVVVRLPELISTLLWFKARRSRAMIVANVVADASAMAAPAGRLRPLLAPIAQALVKRMVRKSNAVIYVTRQWFQRKYPANPDAATLGASNVSLEKSFPTPAPRQYSRMAFQEGARLIAVGHHIGNGKGHDLLIRAVPLLIGRGVPVHLDLIGDGPDTEQLRGLTHDLEVADHVSFRGRVTDRRELAQLLDAADIFLMPSRAEGLPRAMVEAMSRGLCCLGARVGGIPELAPNEALFEPDDVSDLVRCLVAVTQSPETATRLAARQWALALDILAQASPEHIAQFLRGVEKGGAKTGRPGVR